MVRKELRSYGYPYSLYIHPASRGVAAHTAGFFLSVTGAKGGVEHEDRVCWPPASPCKLAGERQ